MSYTTSEVMAVRQHLYETIWNGTEISDIDLTYEIVDMLLTEDYISDVPFQEIKEETNA